MNRMIGLFLFPSCYSQEPLPPPSDVADWKRMDIPRPILIGFWSGGMAVPWMVRGIDIPQMACGDRHSVDGGGGQSMAWVAIFLISMPLFNIPYFALFHKVTWHLGHVTDGKNPLQSILSILWDRRHRARCTPQVKGPKREIFDSGVFAQIRPIWIGDLGTTQKKLLIFMV